ncbi:hypothetical protein PLESTB_001176200 [Pleodorina starrii]|uniref:Uncharacterized protein n=1 Tax=Pleodorina starrii TaxID=330485 RepID=A0A9W6BRD0_9CHLO|nr:hypothetical protein PLESTM_000252100 [Pleodorina starrii]GLC57041.1 hypothetical protein PLESTB_001176200 [Pleodorina starrii]GLC64872.1 hypothetical protein PLESTF_000216300 [Pleodorina starrii]
MSSALAQRQWRQRAQTAVRRAVTAAKEARGRFQALSDGGDAALSDLANSALQLSHLAALRLPGPLAELVPDVRAAAAAKLARQLAARADGLQERVEGLRGAVEGLAGALGLLEEVPQDEPWMRNAAIFHTMPLPRVRQLLGKVYDMYRLEYDSKAAVAAALVGLVAGPVGAAEAADVADGVGGDIGRRRDVRGAAALAEISRQGGAAAKRLPDLYTTYMSVWMLSPYLEDEQADEALGALSEDMVSF